MKKKLNKSERGQALVVVALAAVGLFAFAALAIDGSMAFSEKRHAQNAADTAVLAGALAHARGNDIDTAALARALSNGYDDNGTSNEVTVTIVDSPTGVCPANVEGKDITVDIVTTINTTFARVIGRTQITSAVTATSRACGSYTGPPFDGNAIVSLAPSGVGYDGRGTPDWNITGGGVMSNSSSSPSATCDGDAGVNAPSVTSVGSQDFTCHTVNIGTQTTGATQLTYSDYSALLPREPACDGTATFSGGQWHPQSGADGSQVSWTGDADFSPGLYCITNSPGPFHGQLSGTNVTFYIMSSTFSMKFNGAGNLTASAPTSGEYDGVLIYMAPQVDGNGNLLNTQALDMRGNGTGNVTGTILAPSADVTMFGNSATGAFNSQIIAYQVDAGGDADITVTYQADDNYQAALPITLTVLK